MKPLLLLLPILSFLIAAPGHSKDLNKVSAEHGFYIYKEVCSTCHSIKEAHYGDFLKLGVPKKVLESWAATHSVPDGLNDEGGFI